MKTMAIHESMNYTRQRNEWGHMGFPRDSDNSQFCQVEQGSLPVSEMIHLNSNNIVLKHVTLHEIS